MPSRKKSTPPETTESLSFEDAMSKIESIVESMEGEELPLEDLVAQYEKGSALLNHCDSVLDSARKRIELITLANREQNSQAASTSSSPNAPQQNAGEPEDNNDISLF